MRRVVVTGMAALSPLGGDWKETFESLQSLKNRIIRPGWEDFKGLNTHLGSAVPDHVLPPDTYPRKLSRGMGRVSLLAVRASELALEDAGILGDPILESGRVGVAYGSSGGSTEATGEFARMVTERSTDGINATTYVRMMAHTAPVNISVFFKLQGQVVTTSSACTSGSQGLGYAARAIQRGEQDIMIAGGAEELSPGVAAVFDTLFACSVKNDTPDKTPSPFDRDRDGLVVGEGACTFILEDLEHAKARGARIYAELAGFGTNSDGAHITKPTADTMRIAIDLALKDARMHPDDIGYVSAHGTATDHGDIAETTATAMAFGRRVPISSLKSYVGHTLGACGSLESYTAIKMMDEKWFHPTLNLNNVDERCGDLDYIKGEGREIKTDVIMNNNFAFGGINTSLIFKRWKG